MVLLKSCCCWWERHDSLKIGSYRSCVYTTFVAAFQLILGAWAIYRILWIRFSPNLDERWQPNEIEYWFPPGADGFLFVTVLVVIAKLIVGILLWKGINKGEFVRSKRFILAWLFVNSSLQIYIIVVTVYICGYLQFFRLYDMYFMNRGMIVGVWFGVIDMVIMFWAIMCVLSFYQQLYDQGETFGVQKKKDRAVWNFDLGITIRSGSIGTSRPPSTAYSFESLAHEKSKLVVPMDTYGVNSSSV